jgi:hypothetical protein
VYELSPTQQNTVITGYTYQNMKMENACLFGATRSLETTAADKE